MKRLLAALLLLAAPLACTKENHPPTPSAQATTGASAAATPGSELPPEMVVATINGESVTAKDLDESIKPELEQLKKQFGDQKFKLREQGLDSLVVKKLVDAEAKKANMTADDWIKQQVESKNPPVSEEEAKAFFDKNSAQLPPGADFAQLKEKLTSYLTNKKRQDAAMTLFEDLKKKAKVDIKLEEPKVQVAAVGPSKGPEGAPVTIVEFSDFQCPYCSKVEPTIKQVMDSYAGKVRFVFRDYPLPFHEHAEKAAEASHCAEAQGKYWEMHDAMFANQDKIDVDGLKKLAKEQGIDSAKFDTCLDSGSMKATVDANKAAGSEVGVGGTPHFFINGHALSGAVPYAQFKEAIDKELAKVASK